MVSYHRVGDDTRKVHLHELENDLIGGYYEATRAEPELQFAGDGRHRQYAKEQTAAQRSSYEAAEASARVGRVGLWQDADPVPPWEWRRR